MANNLLAVAGPITTATRLEKKLSRRANISVRIVHTPEELSSGGCSYSVRSGAENLPVIMETAKKHGIKIKAYYIVENSGGKEVYHVIS